MCELHVYSRVVFELHVYSICFQSLSVRVCVHVFLWFAEHPVAAGCGWGLLSLYTLCVCVFVAASHRESLVQSWCVGELICIP